MAEKREQIAAVLKRVLTVGREEGTLPETVKAVENAQATLGYEAAGFRIPHCGECGQPRPSTEMIHRINQDRQMPDPLEAIEEE